CKHAGCNKRKAYGDATMRVAEACSKHKQPHHINLMTKRCNWPSCSKYASFKTDSQTFCALHKPANSTDFRSSAKVCRYPECKKQASYGIARPLWCRDHMNISVDVDVKNRLCTFGNCSQRALYGDASSGFNLRCAQHR
ncbi:hypothetical protein GUITHDRAFT_49756, partial [Guillardia theta CCMP2712]